MGRNWTWSMCLARARCTMASSSICSEEVDSSSTCVWPRRQLSTCAIHWDKRRCTLPRINIAKLIRKEARNRVRRTVIITTVCSIRILLSSRTNTKLTKCSKFQKNGDPLIKETIQRCLQQFHGGTGEHHWSVNRNRSRHTNRGRKWQPTRRSGSRPRIDCQVGKGCRWGGGDQSA